LPIEVEARQSLPNIDQAVVVYARGLTRHAREISDYLREAGISVESVKEIESPLEAPESDDSVLVIVGADRDVLSALHAMRDKESRLLIVSPPGSIGFLASVTAEELSQWAPSLANGSYVEREYMRLEATVDGRSKVFSINEVAIFPRRAATLMEYVLKVDDELVWRDVADGLIVATPLGSTAYALSAGGPAILLGTDAVSIVPVNSLDVSKRPIVAPGSAKIEVGEINSRHGCELVADGIERVRVTEHVVVEKTSPLRVLSPRRRARASDRIAKKAALAVQLTDMPPSARFVLSVLEHSEGPLTSREIAQRTTLPSRTVRHALKVLMELGLVERLTDLRDARRCVYRVARRRS